MIFALDAGVSAKNASGVAVLSHAGKLVATDVIRRDAKLEGIAAHWKIAADAIAWLNTRGLLPRIDTFATEWPNAYPNSKVNPNTALMPLCGIIGCVSGMLPPSVKRVSYLPSEWKGTIDGSVMAARVRMLLPLAERELLDAVMPASLRHNAADAVGIGLKFLGRMGRTRVVHNEL